MDAMIAALSDPRLEQPLRDWEAFATSIRSDDRVGIVYHGDLDGAVGAAYGRLAIHRRAPAAPLVPYWIATEEYDFEALRSWIAGRAFARCAFFDISIENHAQTLEALDALVADSVFVFDHHVVSSNIHSRKITVANPTPKKLDPDQRHVPTFMFARAIARKEGLIFPDWLVLLAIFTEGIDFQYGDLARQLFRQCLGMKASGSLRQTYRRSVLPRISSLVRADFASREKQHRTLEALDDLATGQISSLDNFHSVLEDLLGAEASAISSEISRQVADWDQRIRSTIGDEQRLIVIPLESEHSVSGPVASILRGKFPDRVIATYAIHGKTAVFELRTGNDSQLSFPQLLSAVNQVLPLKNFGGHPSAAGASVDANQLDAFVAAFGEQLAHQSHK